jgi:hypothetical protein
VYDYIKTTMLPYYHTTILPFNSTHMLVQFRAELHLPILCPPFDQTNSHLCQARVLTFAIRTRKLYSNTVLKTLVLAIATLLL